MDVCKCIVSARHGGTLNSRRAASPLVWLVEEEERWEASDHPEIHNSSNPLVRELDVHRGSLARWPTSVAGDYPIGERRCQCRPSTVASTYAKKWFPRHFAKLRLHKAFSTANAAVLTD
ncbi:hypothetical protein TNCV_2325911 [Trichonephila clavipes]|nr:hypothetical protein TNCV_2325911 [Trichonephila clavipes]